MIEGFDDSQIRLGHFLLTDRRCRKCGEIKNLVDGFYRTRKNRGPVASSYSYECKECTKKRIIKRRKQYNLSIIQQIYTQIGSSLQVSPVKVKVLINIFS